MGQKITPERYELFRRHPDVFRVTEEHVILKDGRVMDPEDCFTTIMKPLVIIKLHDCCCEQHHLPGTHLLVAGRPGMMKVGNSFIGQNVGFTDYCLYSVWITEEVISPERAKALDLYRMLKEPARRGETVDELLPEGQSVIFTSEGG